MNFSEIFRKYDKVVESFIKKTTSKTTRDIIKVADKYVSKDEEILRQLKEFIKQDGYEVRFGFRVDLPGQFYIEHQNDEGEFEEWVIIELNLVTSVEDGMYSYSVVNLGDEDSYVEVVAVSEDYSFGDYIRWEELDIDIRNGILDYLNFTDLRYDQINESFTRKISRKKNDELISKADTAFVPDGVYILHETLGVRTVDGWNPKDNEGVVGILVIEDDHKIVVALEDSPQKLIWSTKRKLVNKSIEDEYLFYDFNGEEYCRNLNSPDYPAAYYCLNYKKGGRNWYLPSYGEFQMIGRHLDEIQSALETVGGEEFYTEIYGFGYKGGRYWTSSEYSPKFAWYYHVKYRIEPSCKYEDSYMVRPISKFGPSTLKESFTRKISRKKNDELISKADTDIIPDGVYILHETLGVRGVDGWKPEDNEGVVGVLLIEDDHQIVIALEDAPETVQWAEVEELVNEPIKEDEDAESDFNGEYYCRNLNSPKFPAAYYCLNYKKGGRNWYLPSIGELWMIYDYLEEIQTALKTVGGQKFDTSWDEGYPNYWSSTEFSEKSTWYLGLGFDNFTDHRGHLMCGHVGRFGSIRPVSKFNSSNTLKEPFTRKIRRQKNNELISKADTAFVPDGVYILHETLGVRTVDGWNPKDNKGVVGILVVENKHKIVIALEDAPDELLWATKRKSVNGPVSNLQDAECYYKGGYDCRKLNSPKFPAAYYCLNYKKGGLSWYLPSSGELWMIRRYFDEIQNTLETVGGQKFFTEKEDRPEYWSSTEESDIYSNVYYLDFSDGDFLACLRISSPNLSPKRVRPVSRFSSLNTLKESFTRKISRKKNDELISKADSAFFAFPDGVYILHETLGVRTVDGWNPKDNEGVVGILLVEDDHQIMIALEDAPERLQWSKTDKLVNEPIKKVDAKSDFNGEQHCLNLNSPDFPAVYYCKTYNKGCRNWYLPSSGELWLIYNHFEEIQNALETVGGQKFNTSWDEDWLMYWSSTEGSKCAWYLDLDIRDLDNRLFKTCWLKVRPVSKFGPSTLKESFTKKIKKQTSKNVIDNVDEDIKMKSPLIFEDKEVSRVFFEEIVDINDYENGVYTLEDASTDSHEHDGYSEYFPFDNYQSNCWYNNNKIVKFNELQFFTGLKQLPDYAFVNCTSLKELTLPDNLEQIGQGAFANCISLKTVKMPKNHTLKFIEDSAFANTGLVSVVIPDGVEVIGECAFADCKYLENVVIPPSVKKIERGAFSRCYKLKTVSGIETVSKFGNDVFYGCGLGGERLDNDVFGKCNTLRGFEKTLFSADWLDDSNVVEERFLETYCLNHYDTEDYKYITEKEWEEDEFNPNSPNFDENRFNECVWDCAYDEVSMDWNNFECDLKQLFRGHGGWVCIEDEKYFSDFSSAFDYCIPDNCEWRDLEVKQEEGSLIVCGAEIAPACDRYIADEIDIIYPNEFIDYKSLRFCDPIEKEISL